MRTPLLLAGLSLSLVAQAPVRPLVLKAARLYDGKADRMQSPGLLVVQGKRILAVGPEAKVPEGARVVDLGDGVRQHLGQGPRR